MIARLSLVLSLAAASVACADRTPTTVQQDPAYLAIGSRIVFPDARLPAFDLPKTGERAVKSVLKVTTPLSFGEYVWDDKGVPEGKLWVVADLERQTMSVFRGAHEIGSAVTLYGAEGLATPTGQFRILERRKDHRSNLYDAEMPYMLRLTYDGVAIHGSDVREGYATHGCLGIPNDFARLLFEQARIGDEVFVVRNKQAELTS